MRAENSFSAGWLRTEIADAIENFTKQAYVPQELQVTMRSAAKRIGESQSLRRSDAKMQGKTAEAV
jgi:hypothetical protein